MKKTKNIFQQGPITADFIGNSIAKHQVKTQIGAHEIFLGQVRADSKNDQEVSSIEYTAYEDMANSKADDIREKAFELYDLSCAHVYHSLGDVKAGEICFFVFASSPHRKDARKAVAFIVDEIKKELPIFGKEKFSNDSFQWKKNDEVI